MLKNPQALRLIKERCRRDKEYFINIFCWTYDPRETPAHLPFILYDFQKDFIKWLNDRYSNREDGLVEKSRDMGATWVGMAWLLHSWIFEEGFTAHIGSRKEEYVDKTHDIKTLFGKIRYMLFRLPNELIPNGFIRREHSAYMKLFNPVNGNIITGESANPDFGRQARASVCWLDEFASWPNDEASWTSISEVTDVKFLISTPKGRNNCFGRQRFHSNISYITLNWILHPKKDANWYRKKQESKQYTAQQLAQEVDINYSGSAGNPVFPEFDSKKHIKDYEFDPEKILIRSIDFGKRHPCLILAQKVDDTAYIIGEFLGKGVNIFDWGLICDYVVGIKQDSEKINRVRYLAENNLIDNINHISHLTVFKAKKILDFCDHAGNQKSDKSNQTSIEILSGMGFKLRYRWERIDVGVKIICKMLINDKFFLTPACTLTAQGMSGGYHIDKFGQPEKDGYYEHFMDAIRYFIQDLFSYMSIEKKEVQKDKYEKLVDKGVPIEYINAIKEMRNNIYKDDIDKIRQESNNTGYSLE